MKRLRRAIGRVLPALAAVVLTVVVVGPLLVLAAHGFAEGGLAACARSSAPAFAHEVEWSWTPPGWDCAHLARNGSILAEERIDLWEAIGTWGGGAGSAEVNSS